MGSVNSRLTCCGFWILTRPARRMYHAAYNQPLWPHQLARVKTAFVASIGDQTVYSRRKPTRATSLMVHLRIWSIPVMSSVTTELVLNSTYVYSPRSNSQQMSARVFWCYYHHQRTQSISDMLQPSNIRLYNIILFHAAVRPNQSKLLLSWSPQYKSGQTGSNHCLPPNIIF